MPVRARTYSRAHRIEFEPTVRLDGTRKGEYSARRTHAKGADPEQLFVARFGLPQCSGS